MIRKKNVRIARFTTAAVVACALATAGFAPAAEADTSVTAIGVDSGVSDPVCGSPWGEVTFPDDEHFQEKTGFKSLSAGAVSYAYTESIYVYDDSNSLWDSYVVQQSGGLAYRKSWTGQHTDDRPLGAVSVEVYVAGSYLLANGSLCTTAGWIYGSLS